MSVKPTLDLIGETLERCSISCDPAYSKRYVVTSRPLGSGSFGDVLVAYRAVTASEWVRVAVKEVALRAAASLPKLLQRVEAIGREGALMYTARGPRVVAVYRPWFDAAREIVCIPQELCDESLHAFIHRHRGQRASSEVLCSIAFQCLEALEALEEVGVVHGDIKPANILLTWDGAFDAGLPRVKLTDFGLSRVKEEVAGEERVRAVGTPLFMAPECYNLDGRDAPHARDMWALGCTLHLLVTGLHPFPGGTREEVNAAALAGSVVHFSHAAALDAPSRFLYLLSQTFFTVDPCDRPHARDLLEMMRAQMGFSVPPAVSPTPRQTYRRLVTCGAQRPLTIYGRRGMRSSGLPPRLVLPVGRHDVLVVNSSRPDNVRGGWVRVAYPTPGYCRRVVGGHPTLHPSEDPPCLPASVVKRHPRGSPTMTPLSASLLESAMYAAATGDAAPTPHAPTPYNPQLPVTMTAPSLTDSRVSPSRSVSTLDQVSSLPTTR